MISKLAPAITALSMITHIIDVGNDDFNVFLKETDNNLLKVTDSLMITDIVN